MYNDGKMSGLSYRPSSHLSLSTFSLSLLLSVVSAERPVHKSKAHVFQIDPNTRKQWKPCATSSVPVGIYHDPQRQFYRIVAMQGATALVNSHMRCVRLEKRSVL